MVEETSNGWQGPTPFYLVLSFPDENVGIDLDERAWATTYAEYMRRPGQWILVHKDSGRQMLALIVYEGDQPYYTARHVGIAGGGGGNEITAYGLGKKHPDGSVERMWLMPNGMVCLGDDVDDIGVLMVKQLGPR